MQYTKTSNADYYLDHNYEKRSADASQWLGVQIYDPTKIDDYMVTVAAQPTALGLINTQAGHEIEVGISDL